MRIALALILLATGLAGCSDEPTLTTDDAPDLDVTSTTGGIRGVVVDQAITPVGGATVMLLQSGDTSETDEAGLFSFTGLNPGTYFLSVEKQLYEGVQTSVEVVAGVVNPPILNVQVVRIEGLVPYIETIQFDGFYECSFATIFITDSCDFAVRTASDEGVPVIPRNLQNNVNSYYAVFGESIVTVVQETWWDQDASRTFRSSLQATPIDNGCDCSTKHMEAKGTEGYIFDRMDNGEFMETNTGRTQSWPDIPNLENGEVVIRGFIPFQSGTDVDYAVNLEFQIFTNFFHAYTPDAAWTFETRDNYVVPE